MANLVVNTCGPMLYEAPSEDIVFKSIQWNIGGGKARNPGVDPHEPLSFHLDGMAEIIEVLESSAPNIITVQEAQGNAEHEQIRIIAGALGRMGLKRVAVDYYADSHIDPGMKLGQGIVSRGEITEQQFELLHNPGIMFTPPGGSKPEMSHDKGVSTYTVMVAGRPMKVKTLHAPPFRRLGLDPRSGEGLAVVRDMRQKLLEEDTTIPLLIQGDFNLDVPDLPDVLNGLIGHDTGIQEVPMPGFTTPKGRTLDRVLYRGLSLVGARIITSVRTDHFAVETMFSCPPAANDPAESPR